MARVEKQGLNLGAVAEVKCQQWSNQLEELRKQVVAFAKKHGIENYTVQIMPNSGKVVFRFGYWALMPAELYQEFRKEFNCNGAESLYQEGRGYRYSYHVKP